MTHVSLFTGIGGLDLAAEWAGFETVLQVERDPYCLKVLEKHWPDVPRVTDIREVTSESVNGPVTVVSGGFPCQPFSQAGKRGGADDDRYLWPEMLRVVRELSPAYVVAENVSGLLSLNDGAEFELVCTDLEREGYEVLPFHYPAAGVGAPHKRDRVFIVAHRNPDNEGESTRTVDAEVAKLSDVEDTTRLRCREVRTWESRTFGEDVADTERIGWNGRRGETGDRTTGQPRQEQPAGCGTAVADSDEPRLQGHGRPDERADEWLAWKGRRPFPRIWESEPPVGRVATGISKRVDRLRALGNAVVPAQAYPIFAAIAQEAT